jgi:CheY-like chemotaxis protein
LQQHPFVRTLAGSGDLEAMQVRRTLIEAIESTNPGSNFYFRAPQARPYQMLQLHYVERLTIQKAALELGVSERQAYRDLRQGEENALAFLRKQEMKAQPVAEVVSAAAPRGENLASLVQGAMASIERLAAQQNVTLDVQVSTRAFTVPVDPAIARQVLVSLFSRAIQQAQGTLRLELNTSADPAELLLQFTPRTPDRPAVVDPLVMSFIQQIGWAYQDAAGAPRQVRLSIPGAGLHLLMIDDDEGFISLVRRYLTGYVVKTSVAHNGADGLRAACQDPPGVILLDVMMPGLDGWQVLQTLRTDPLTMNIPTIVCSVFNDPELARSLGATLLLPKPASQESLLAALRQTGLLPWYKE